MPAAEVPLRFKNSLREMSGDPEVDRLLGVLRSRSSRNWLVSHAEAIVTPARGWFGRGGACKFQSFWQLYIRDGEKYFEVDIDASNGGARRALINYVRGYIDALDRSIEHGSVDIADGAEVKIE